MIVKEIKRAVFLDRDGTISPDKFGYIKDPEIYHLYPETPAALRLLQEMGFLIFIVTNQSGIARGYLDLEQLAQVHKKMLELLAQSGVKPNGVYFSPYHREGIVKPFNIHHEDRKPGIGMFKRAKREFHFDPSQSFMIGDRASDIGFAHNAGMKSILLLSGNGADEFGSMLTDCSLLKPTFICENILTAAELIKQYYP